MKKLILYSLFIGLTAFGGNTRKVIAQTNNWTVDLEVISQIREEGLQRSKISETLSYMTDVLGARLTNSEDMERARSWVMEEMRRIGLTNIIQDPFMDYGVSCLLYTSPSPRDS